MHIVQINVIGYLFFCHIIWSCEVYYSLSYLKKDCATYCGYRNTDTHFHTSIDSLSMGFNYVTAIDGVS